MLQAGLHRDLGTNPGFGWRADCLARSAGAEYTRYADDLAFSGGEDFERRVERFSTHAAAILKEEGFTVQHRKTPQPDVTN